MNARILTNGLALSTTLFLATAAMAIDTDRPIDSSVGNDKDIRTGFKTENVVYAPTSLGDSSDNTNFARAGIRYDPTRGDDLGSLRDPSLFEVLTARYAPVAIQLLLSKH